MAETLGSLVDKLTIKSLREFHLGKMLQQKKSKFPKQALREKLSILKKQKAALFDEIEVFVVRALDGNLILKDEKLKLYNRPDIIGRIGKVEKISSAIEGLARKNFELWRLEDEARREDVSLEYIGKVKKNIDIVNQHRNDFMDKIDFLLEKAVASKRLGKKSK